MSDYRDVAQWLEADYPTSTIVCEHGIAIVPNDPDCELPAAFGRAAVEHGRTLLLGTDQ